MRLRAARGPRPRLPRPARLRGESMPDVRVMEPVFGGVDAAFGAGRTVGGRGARGEVGRGHGHICHILQSHLTIHFRIEAGEQDAGGDSAFSLNLLL